MKILQLVVYYPPAWGYGGPPRAMFSLARGLQQRGHHVTVFTTDVWDESRRITERQRVLDGVEVHAFPNLSNRLAWRRKVFVPWGLVPALRRRVREFDVVHISGVRSFLHARVHRILRARGVPYVIDAHGALPKPVGWRRPAAALWDPAFLVPMLQGAGALLAQTRHEADLYRSYAPEGRVEALPLPVELTEFEHPAPIGVLRERLGVDADTFVVLFLGRIERRKGLEFLLEAYARFARRAHRPTRLVIVGRDSGSLAEVQVQISTLGLDRQVALLGPLYGEERLAAYREADVFALTPGYWEETSLAALEACASGTPCLITVQAEVPGLDESGAGRTVRYGDHDAVVSFLASLAGDPGLRQRMGAAAAGLVRRTFAADHVATRLEGIFQRILSAAPA